MGELLQNLESVYARWGNGPKARPQLQANPENNLNYERLMQKGKRAWSDRFGDYKRPPKRVGRKPQNRVEFDPLSNVGEFKVQPILHPCHVTCRRPMMGRCCECLVVSKKNFYTDDVPLAGFRDILRVPQQSSRNNVFVRSFCHVMHACSRDQSEQYPDVRDEVLCGMRVEEAIERTAAELSGHDLRNVSDRMDADYDKACKQCRKKAKKMLKRMEASTTNWMIRLTGWALLKILGSLLDTLVIHEGQMDMVKRAFKKNRHIPLLFLPLHRSHLDYIILTFVLWNWNIHAPYVAAGDNLDIPFFKWLLKGLGGFFIRRKLDRDSGRKDLLYRSVLHGYMSEILRNGQNMEFFLEGGRSRSGRVLHPKAGLLSVVTETFLEGTIPDAYLVPVSISYERVVDGDFTNEQIGNPKQTETFWRAIKAIFRVLRTSFGNVRVDLGQPFSLQEYYSVVKSSTRSISMEDTTAEKPVDQSETGRGLVKTQSEGRFSGSNTSLYGTDVIAEEQRNLVQGLAEHVVYNSMNTTAIMSTNLVAYLLLTKFRKGVTLKELTLNVTWLREEVTCRGRDVGFSGDSYDVITHALNVLGSNLVKVNKRDDLEVDLLPCLDLPHVFELAYYANVTGMVFAPDCLMATAILASTDEDLTVTSTEMVTVSKENILNNAEFLATLLRYEFLLTAPCTSLQTVLIDTMEQFFAKQLLTRPEEDYECDRSRTSRPTNYSFHSDSEDDEDDIPDEKLEIHIQTRDFALWYPFLWSGLAPIIEAYWVTACCLGRLLQQDMEEKQFIKLVHSVAKERVMQNFASFVESMAYDTIKNALLAYQHLKITEIYTINGLRMVSLCDSYTCQDAINDLIARVEKYRL